MGRRGGSMAGPKSSKAYAIRRNHAKKTRETRRRSRPSNDGERKTPDTLTGSGPTGVLERRAGPDAH